MRVAAWLAAVVVIVLGAVPPAWGSTSAIGSLTRTSADGLALAVRNTGTTTINALSFDTGKSGYSLSSAGPAPCATDPGGRGGSLPSVACRGVSLAPGGTFTTTFTIAPHYPDNGGGTLTYTARVGDVDQGGAFPVSGPSSAGGGGEQPGAVRVSSVAVSPYAFFAASKGASTRRLTGARVSYTLSRVAQVTFRIEHAVSGRKSQGKCVARTRANRNGAKCSRYVKVKGSFRQQGSAGTNRFHFTGRIGGKALRSGRYRFAAQATDSSGHKSSTAHASFRVKP